MHYIVRCQSATGRIVDVQVYATTDNAACCAALTQLDPDFRAVYALRDPARPIGTPMVRSSS